MADRAKAGDRKKPAEKAAAPVERVGPGWRDNWQGPAIIAGVGALAAGVVVAFVTAPKPKVTSYMEQAAELLAQQEYQPALDVLNTRVRPFVQGDALPPSEVTQFHVLRARALYLAQKGARINADENHAAIVKEYQEAERRAGTLEARDRGYLIDTLIALKSYDRALERIAAMPASEREQRAPLLRRVVEAKMSARGGSDGREGGDILALLADFLADPALGPDDRAWALGKQAEALIRDGFVDRAIARLLQTMPRLTNAEPAALGGLFLLLGKAYFEAGALADAAKQLRQAVALLGDDDAKLAEAAVMLARLDEMNNQPADAKQKYAAVVADHADTPAKLAALLGLAEVQASLGEHGEALQSYAALVKDLSGGAKDPEVTPERVTRSLLERYTDRFGGSEPESALEYARLAERLYTAEAQPMEVLIAMARAHRRLGDELLRDLPETGRAAALAALDPATREQARVHYESAAGSFKAYADRVVLTDNTAFADAMWLAADSYDRAGDRTAAAALYVDYANGFPGDPRQVEARFRLGRAFQARGDAEEAATYYRGLIEDAKGGVAGIGRFAESAYVPLAQTLLGDGDPNNDEEAERLLLDVVEGRISSPASPTFREALVELARLDYAKGRFGAAIGRLEEALARLGGGGERAGAQPLPRGTAAAAGDDGGDSGADELRFKLADCYRKDAAAIADTLTHAVADHERRELEETRRRRLQSAAALFERVRASLAERDPRRLDEIERLRLRDAQFHIADCAFQLGEYESAIRQYDAARNRYPKDPASLAAMMQIVNAYVQMGDLKQARTANERALRFYEELPADAWADPSLPISRADWQRWLDSIAQFLPSPQAAVGESKPIGGPGEH